MSKYVDKACGVCLEDYKCPDTGCVTDSKHICVLPCSHHGHDSCMQRWITSNDTCPICRAECTVCNHGTLTDHRKQVIIELLSSTRDELQNLKREIQMQEDHMIASRLHEIEHNQAHNIPLIYMLQQLARHAPYEQDSD